MREHITKKFGEEKCTQNEYDLFFDLNEKILRTLR